MATTRMKSASTGNATASIGDAKPLNPIQAESAAAIVVLARRIKDKLGSADVQLAEQIENHALALLRGQPVLAASTGNVQ
jgi:hypothetical protein